MSSSNKAVFQPMSARCLCLFLLFGLFSLAGCGGGGGAKSKTTANRGKAILTILWPQPAADRNSRLIPQDTQSIVVTLQFLDKNVPTPIGDTLIQRPDAGFPNKTETKLDNLPIGNLLVSAKAYATKTPTASDVALAVSLEFPLVVTDGIPTPITVNLNGVVSTIDIKPEDSQFILGKSQLTSGQTLRLIATPQNDANPKQYVPITSTLQWSVQDNPSVLSVDAKSGLVTALSPGDAVVQVEETETHVRSSVPLTVRNGSVLGVVIDGPASRRINVNASLTLNAIVTDDQNHNISVTDLQWISDAPAIADVSRDPNTSNTHNIVGLAAGVAHISVHETKSNRDSPKITVIVGTGTLQNLSVTTLLPNASPVLTAGGIGLTLVATGTDDANLPYSLTTANLTWTATNSDGTPADAATVAIDPVTGYGNVTPVHKGNNIQITVTEATSGKSARFPASVSVLLSVLPITVDTDHPTLHGGVNCLTSIVGALPTDTPGVTWSVVDANGRDIHGDNAGGTIVSTGDFTAQYTAPLRAGVYYLLATSKDGSRQQSPLRAITVQSGTGTVTVQ